jgi:hypothetical protein
MNTITKEPETQTLLTSLVGETLILDHEGNHYSLEDLASEADTHLTVPAIDSHGRLTFARAEDFRIAGWTKTVYKVTMSNGHKIEATADHQFLSASGEWVPAKALSFGFLLRSATYNPRHKNPNLSINEVSSVTVKELTEQTPVYGFTVQGHGNLFIVQEIADGYSLICVRN